MPEQNSIREWSGGPTGSVRAATFAGRYISRETSKPSSVALKAASFNEVSSGVSGSRLSLPASRFHTWSDVSPPSVSHGNGRRLSGSTDRDGGLLEPADGGLDCGRDAACEVGSGVPPPVLLGEVGPDLLNLRGE